MALAQPAKAAGRFERWRLRISKFLRYAVPAFIILVVGVPPGTWRYLAGQIFLTDGCHHLNFFFMGPALSFAHGKAFGTEIYSQYGIGWPLLASALACSFSALTYGNLVGMEIVYGCVYYLALFFLLRSCFKQELWAAFGVILAIYWQIFSGMNPARSFGFPLFHADAASDGCLVLPRLGDASTVGESSPGPRWPAWLAALGVFFETETGVYLLVTFLIYSVLQAGLAAGEGRAAGAKGLASASVAFYSTAAAALLPLLLYASRGTLFTRRLLARMGGGAGRYAGAGSWRICPLPNFRTRR